MPQIRFALSRGFAVSGWMFDGVTRGGRAPEVALDPWLLSAALPGLSVRGLCLDGQQRTIGVFDSTHFRVDGNWGWTLPRVASVATLGWVINRRWRIYSDPSETAHR